MGIMIGVSLVPIKVVAYWNVNYFVDFYKIYALFIKVVAYWNVNPLRDLVILRSV